VPALLELKAQPEIERMSGGDPLIAGD